MHSKTIMQMTLLWFLGVVMLGCKAKPAPDSGFLDQPEKMAKQARFPFHRAYWDHKYDAGHYTELLVQPVNTRYMLEQDFWQKANIRSDRLAEDTLDIANYMRSALVKAALDDPNRRFRIVETPGPRTLVLEMALVELVPNKIALGALGIASLAAPPAAGVATGIISGKGSVAMEGRIRDGATGQVIGMFADREEGATAPVDLGSLTWYHHAHTIIDTWATQLIELANTPKDHIVKDSDPFTLRPW
jgi:hypothetical protein